MVLEKNKKSSEELFGISEDVAPKNERINTTIPENTVIKEETVVLKKTELEVLMDRIKRLEATAEKSRLANYDDKNKSKVSKTVKIRMMDEKVVISWGDMVSNLVEKNVNGVWGENQKVILTYENGETEEMEFIIFNRRYKYLKAEILSKTIENQGTDEEKIILKLRTEDGREYSIDKKFVN